MILELHQDNENLYWLEPLKLIRQLFLIVKKRIRIIIHFLGPDVGEAAPYCTNIWLANENVPCGGGASVQLSQLVDNFYQIG